MTGRYWRVTITLDLAPLATFWFPEMPLDHRMKAIS
jgi:hypothetical protein